MTDFNDGGYDDDHYGERKKKPERSYDGERERDEFDPDSTLNAVKDILRDIEKKLYALAPAVVRGLCGLWNLMMGGLVAIKVMPFIAKHPWVLVALIIIIMLFVPILSPLFAAMGALALSKNVRGYDDFMIDMPGARRVSDDEDGPVDIDVSF